jgi:hypothetical protein
MNNSARFSEIVLKSNKIKFFIILVLCNVFVYYLNQRFILTNRLYYNSLIQQLSIERIDFMIEESKKWQFLTLFSIPLVLVIKICFTAFCLYVGLSFSGTSNSFKEVFNIALKAEATFIVANIIRLTINLMTQRVSNFNDLNYYPLSLISITGTENIYTWLVYPLQTLNLFELFYWLALAKGLEIVTSKGFSSMLLLVLYSYVTGLIIWIMLVMLFILQFT